MRLALLPLMLVPLLAGCVAPAEPLRQDPAPRNQESPEPPGAPAAGAPAATPPPAGNASDAAEPGNDTWEGQIHVGAVASSTHSPPREFLFAGPVAFNLTVTVSSGVQVGGLWAFLVTPGQGGCTAADGGEFEPALEAEGDAPLALHGTLPAGAYCGWVSAAQGSVHAATAFRAEASWLPAPPA